MTINQLRKDCAKHGIKPVIKTYSHGPHISFFVDGIRSSSIMSPEEYSERRGSLLALRGIKRKYKNIQYNGEHLYGLASI